MSDIVAVRGDDLTRLLAMFSELAGRRTQSVVRVWIDPLDRAVKFKAGNGVWSAPLGEIEVTA
jgi:hypothetical protein